MTGRTAVTDSIFFFFGLLKAKWKQMCCWGSVILRLFPPTSKHWRQSDGARLSEFYEQEAKVDDEATDPPSYQASVHPRSSGT